jgi:hypothetical protein
VSPGGQLLTLQELSDGLKKMWWITGIAQYNNSAVPGSNLAFSPLTIATWKGSLS